MKKKNAGQEEIKIPPITNKSSLTRSLQKHASVDDLQRSIKVSIEKQEDDRKTPTPKKKVKKNGNAETSSQPRVHFAPTTMAQEGKHSYASTFKRNAAKHNLAASQDVPITLPSTVRHSSKPSEVGLPHLGRASIYDSQTNSIEEEDELLDQAYKKQA